MEARENKARRQSYEKIRQLFDISNIISGKGNIGTATTCAKRQRVREGERLSAARNLALLPMEQLEFFLELQLEP